MPEEKSLVLDAFVREVGDTFPQEQVAKLAAHKSEIARCSSRHDHKRARLCASWAIALVEAQSNQHEEWEVIKAEHKFWTDAWEGAAWSVQMRMTPGEGVEIEWAEESADIALRVAGVSGWAAVDWEGLLTQLIRINDD
jgi:hypothetical protein